MKPFAIAGLQLQLNAAGDNLPRMQERLDYLMFMFPWVQMVVFSELAACGPAVRRAEPLPGPAERTFQQMAAKHAIWLVNGSHFELRDGKTWNTASVIDPGGKVIGRYRKLFPFRPYERGVEPGREFFTFDVPDAGRFGLSICYDMWFPETSRTLATMGVEVIIHPSMTTTIDRDVELSIARATAATNQCFVVDINGTGGTGNGRSLMVGPAGDVLYQAGSAEELIPLELNLERVRRERERGLLGLGQPLKSFRDAAIEFPAYSGNGTSRAYLDSLGPLERPHRPMQAATTTHAETDRTPED